MESRPKEYHGKAVNRENLLLWDHMHICMHNDDNV